MFKKRILPISVTVTALVALLVLSAMASVASPAVDRGLPTAHLNNAAGSQRSNVAWSFGNDWITGDDFTVGVTGETWVVTGIRTWQVGTLVSNTSFAFGDRYDSVSLYNGPASPVGGVSQVATGKLASGSSTNTNPYITHSRVNYANSNQPNYEGSTGNQLQLWQTDFTNLSLVVDGGVKQNFAVDGTVRASVSSYFFNHASNAALSGSVQQGSDGRYLAWDRSALGAAPFVCDSGDAVLCGGWDKSSDINVQVFASRVATVDSYCKNDGWMTLARSDGSSFKNQGDCVSYAQNGR